LSGRKWPAGQFAIDMGNGFVKIDALQGLPLRERFEAVFNELFVSTTYHDQCHHWAKATTQQRDQALAAGHTPAGHWLVF
ncbi:hypothetical protein L208DRAFT_1145957, partial [Tricholoma matsutake]